MAVSGIVGSAVIEVLPDTTKFAAKLHDDVTSSVDKAASSSSSSFDKIANVGQAAFLGIATAAVGFGAAAIKAALEGEQSQAQLRQAIENTGGSFDVVGPKVEALSESFVKFGYENDQVEAAVTRLTQITGDSGKAIDLMGTAANLAAARHLDLTTAANLVGRAAEGQITPLKKMGIQIDDTGSSAGNADAAIKALNDRFGGAAQAQADTYAGKLAAFHAEVSNLTEKVGNFLLPVLGDMFGILSSGVGFFEHNYVAAGALAIIVGGPLLAAIGAYLIKQAALVASKLGDFLEAAGGAAKAMAAQFAEAGVASSLLLGATGLIIIELIRLVDAQNKTQKAADDAAKSFAENYVQGLDNSATKAESLQKRSKDLSVELYTGKRQTDENAASIDVYHKALQDARTATDASTAATQDQTTALQASTGPLADVAAATGLTTDRVDELAKKLNLDLSKNTDDATAKIQELSQRLSETNPTALLLQDALAKLADKTADATEKSQAFKSALDLLIGGNIDAQKAVVNLYDKIDELGQKLKDNGTNLDFHTTKGRENLGVIEDTVTAVRNHIESMEHAGASASDMARALDGDTKSFDDQLKKAGFTTKEIQNLNAQYGLVPSTINTVITADFGELYANAAKVDQKFSDLLSSKKVSGTLRTFADGGWVDAPPGIPVPAIVHGGEFVLSQEMLKGGRSPSGPTYNVEVNFPPGTDAATVAFGRQMIREELVGVLEGIGNRTEAKGG